MTALFERIVTETTQIGAGAVIRSGTVVYACVRIGAGFDCGHNVIVREGAEIADGVYLKNNAEIMKAARIGAGSRVSGVVADEVVVGDRVSSFGVLTHPYRRYLAPVRTTASARLPARDLESPSSRTTSSSDGAPSSSVVSGLGPVP